jgi:site-specific recombinase XerD
MPKFIRISRVARATKSDKTKRTIFLRIFPSWENRKDFTLTTKITIPATKWNNNTKSITGKGIECNRLNSQLNQLESEVQNIFQDYIHAESNPKLLQLKAEIEYKIYNKGVGKNKELLLSELFDKYIDLNKSELCKTRIKRYKFVQRCVNEFNNSKLEKHFEVKNLNKEWRDEFKQFMMNRYNYKQSTLNGYLKVLHAAVKYAYNTEYISIFPFKNCKFDKFETEIKYLTEVEYLAILNFDFSNYNKQMQQTADCFLFACNTGLAYSDMKSLKKSDLEIKDGYVAIVKNREKTNVRFTVPLNNFALTIIEKYKSNSEIQDSEFLLPVINLNGYNKLLKFIGIMTGIKKNLTSHVARHTFATTKWLDFGGSLETLQGILGHNKILTTQIYGKITTLKVREEADLVFRNQNKNKKGF